VRSASSTGPRVASARQVALLALCALVSGLLVRGQAAPARSTPPSLDEAGAFIARAEETLNTLGVRASRADWVQSTYITSDTQAIASETREAQLRAATQFGKEAARFRDLQLPPDLGRKLMLLRLQLTMPAPADPGELAELTQIATSLEADYGKGTYCRQGKDGTQECLDITAIERIMAESRNPRELADLWAGWRRIGPPMRARYTRFVDLTNKGARELGFENTGALWRSNYDMPPDAFSAEVERLWQQVRPFYVSLHAYVRRRLTERYGAAVVPPNGPIPAHLLGNPWAQEWGNIYDLVAPAGAARGFNLTERLRAQKMDARAIVRTGEGFFTSLGFARLPATFWERSLFTKPADRDVVCHASAWSIDNREDVRLKMCIQVNQDDFNTVHHELGHTYYQLAYRQQPFLFMNSANDAFHEAIGDTIALSITPAYLQKIGLVDAATPAREDTGLLLRQALDTIAFLPFGLLIDQWRWHVFSGDITPEHYNESWWDLRRCYQGVDAPVARSEQDFDPWRASSSSSSTAPSARPPGRPVRCTAVRFTGMTRRGSACGARWRWERAAPGPMRWRRSPEDGRWMPPPSWTTSRR
jgi:peptidyl-dipeptidase A